MVEEPSLLERYRLMCVMRAFEEACAEGIVTGELRAELHLASGQEAIAAGMVGTLRPDDWMVGTHRSHQDAIAKGVPPLPLMLEIFEKADGLCRGKGGHIHLFDMEHRYSNTGIVGSALPVAAGHAYAAKLDGTDQVAIGITGDGGANTGQFHETMNMAAIWSLPLVVLVANNRYGISVPADDVIAGSGIAERVSAYGAWGQRVDGTDVEVVVAAFAEATEHARSGAGPALLEATCHRLRGHYEGDPDLYRSAAYRKEMIEVGDPIPLAGAKLVERGEASDASLADIARETEEEIRAIREVVRHAPGPHVSEAMTDIFVEVTR